MGSISLLTLPIPIFIYYHFLAKIRVLSLIRHPVSDGSRLPDINIQAKNALLIYTYTWISLFVLIIWTLLSKNLNDFERQGILENGIWQLCALFTFSRSDSCVPWPSLILPIPSLSAPTFRKYHISPDSPSPTGYRWIIPL